MKQAIAITFNATVEALIPKRNLWPQVAKKDNDHITFFPQA